MLLRDTQGVHHTPIRKFGDSRLPLLEMSGDERQPSLANLFLADGRLILPVGNGKFRVEADGEILTVVNS
jgi:hypothetical protein